jgi:hypothetical protein
MSERPITASEINKAMARNAGAPENASYIPDRYLTNSWGEAGPQENGEFGQYGKKKNMSLMQYLTLMVGLLLVGLIAYRAEINHHSTPSSSDSAHTIPASASPASAKNSGRP